MLRLSAKVRPQPYISDERQPPTLTLIQGGLSFRREKDSPTQVDFGPLVYLLMLRSRFEERRRGKEETIHESEEVPIPQAEADEVGEGLTPREAYDAFIEQDERRVDRKAYRRTDPVWKTGTGPDGQRALYLPKRVLRQFVKRVLGHDGGLEDYVYQGTVAELGCESHRLFRKVQNRMFDELLLDARRFVQRSEDSGLTTRKGYLIHRAEHKRVGFVITLHHQQPVVVGIYTQAHFDRRRQNASARMISHQRAMAFRHHKPRRYCR